MEARASSPVRPDEKTAVPIQAFFWLAWGQSSHKCWALYRFV